MVREPGAFAAPAADSPQEQHEADQCYQARTGDEGRSRWTARSHGRFFPNDLLERLIDRLIERVG